MAMVQFQTNGSEDALIHRVDISKDVVMFGGVECYRWRVNSSHPNDWEYAYVKGCTCETIASAIFDYIAHLRYQNWTLNGIPMCSDYSVKSEYRDKLAEFLRREIFI